MNYGKSVLLSIFNRKGGPGLHTMSFACLDVRQADRILELCAFEPGEEPVVIALPGEDVWTLITTRRVVHWAEGRLGVVRHSDIVAVEPTQFGAVAKEYMRLLRIRTRRGASDCVVEIEAGAPFSGIWNLLAFVARSNRSRMPITDVETR
jgi:hypothetical protein